MDITHDNPINIHAYERGSGTGPILSPLIFNFVEHNLDYAHEEN
jgi:hypothetical protein